MYDFLKDAIESWAKLNGWSEEVTAAIIFGLAAIFFGAMVAWGLYKLLGYLLLLRNRKILNNDLHPFYSVADVYKATTYYLPTKYQNVSPAEDDEPGSRYIASAKEQLIPMFLNKAFKRKGDGYRYYLILADTGMGKTTFLINLYLAYVNQICYPWDRPKYNIKLLPLGSRYTIAEIGKIENPRETILLLDAFDEDVEAISDYGKRLKEIIDATWQFREVVITCRTQFFPSQKEEPYETGYFTHGSDSHAVKFQKLYVSVFSDKDVKLYLKKKYPLWKWKKRKAAEAIAQKSPNLVVRPMLLSNIDTLIESGKQFEHTFQIYEELIKRWVERESSKPGLKEKFGSIELYQSKLHEFSQKLAVNMYLNRDSRGGYYYDPHFDMGLNEGQLLEEGNDLSEEEKKGRSLLNRTSEGKYKFAHKSFLEFFLAKEMLDNPQFVLDFNFEGMDAAYAFIVSMVKVKYGSKFDFSKERFIVKMEPPYSPYYALYRKNLLVSANLKCQTKIIIYALIYHFISENEKQYLIDAGVANQAQSNIKVIDMIISSFESSLDDLSLVLVKPFISHTYTNLDNQHKNILIDNVIRKENVKHDNFSIPTPFEWNEKLEYYTVIKTADQDRHYEVRQKWISSFSAKLFTNKHLKYTEKEIDEIKELIQQLRLFNSSVGLSYITLSDELSAEFVLRFD